ncbi:MAG TPA: ABC transporter permease [Anaerolineaceae bacterium]|nr:ABC transporter permease [Anaerolineaceae bacterium]HPN54218.1 ABC transporter permease [Anaerolineaceae bacterium]
MKLTHLIKEALKSLTANKLRSALTILGIVIGVAAVIAMVSLGRGVQDSINKQFSSMGSAQIMVFSNYAPGITDPKPLTLGDAEALKDIMLAPDVKDVAADLQGNGKVIFGSKAATVSVYGTTGNYAELNNYDFMEGGYFNEEQVSGQSAVAVLGPTLAKTLFDRKTGIVGETIRIEGQPYRVVGVLKERGASGVSFTSTDNAVLIPISVASQRIAVRQTRGQVDTMTVVVRSSSRVNQATDQVKEILRARHRTPIGIDDFMVFVAKDLLDSLNSLTTMVTLFLGAIAAISLLVGGIGIMNIMLVSVTERTREIGLRKALGARRRDILVQFLAEASLLSMVGGAIGIALGWGIGIAIMVISKNSGSAITPIVGLDAILMATLTSSAIGIFFGFYPANRAASLTPVEALRSE